MKSKHESTDVKPWYSRGYTATKNFARKHPFVTGFLVAGIITAAVFTGGTIFLVPPAMFATMAFVGGGFAFFAAILAASAAMAQSPGALLGFPFIALGVAAVLVPPVGVAVLGAVAVVGAGTLGGFISSTVASSLEKKNKAGPAASPQTPDVPDFSVPDFSVNVNSSHSVVSRILEDEKVSSHTSDQSCDERQSVDLSTESQAAVSKEDILNTDVSESKSACLSMG